MVYRVIQVLRVYKERLDRLECKDLLATLACKGKQVLKVIRDLLALRVLLAPLAYLVISTPP
jgi:hypothetical protein